MIRLLCMVLANAVGLIVAANVLEDMSLAVHGFVIAVGLFTAVQLITQPVLTMLGLEQVTALAGSSALISTLIALIVTDIVSDGMTIDGLTTWLSAMVIVWAVALLGGLLLPVLLFKRWLGDHERRRGVHA